MNLGFLDREPKAEWLDPDPGGLESQFWKQYRALPTQRFIGTGPGGDIVWEMAYIKRDLCIEINRITGLGVAGAEPPQNTGSWVNYWTWFTGQGNWEGPLEDAAGLMRNKYTGCYLNKAGTFYVFYHVLYTQ